MVESEPTCTAVSSLIPKYEHPQGSMNIMLRKSLQTSLTAYSSPPPPLPGLWWAPEDDMHQWCCSKFLRWAMRGDSRRLAGCLSLQTAGVMNMAKGGSRAIGASSFGSFVS